MSDNAVCGMCERRFPHAIHIFVGANGDVRGRKGDDDVSLESGRFCPLCKKPCTFYDPEFNNDFCRDCLWMGEGVSDVR